MSDSMTTAMMDENGEEYVLMSSKERVDLARAAYDIKEQIEELTVELERILSKLIHGEFDPKLIHGK